MNPLVEQMLEATNTRDLELIELEDLFAKDCECESNHKYTPYCSGSPCYRVTSCVVEYIVCKSSVDDPISGTKARMSRPGLRCDACWNLASECWTIRPI
ncbi:hypothetical protein SEA_CASSITA_107 [Microbacterium phage Cassita]|nr:hypothetical protein SEA_CASSITA_107 [Microbacterium phage Cassita]